MKGEPSSRQRLVKLSLGAPTFTALAGAELESSPASVAALRAPRERAPVDALYSYWIDRHNGYIDDPGLLACASLRTVELLAAHDPQARWTVDEGEVLTRCARALADLHDEDELSSAVSEAWLGELRVMTGRVAGLRRPVLDWVALLNTAVALWPDRAGQALELLRRPTATNWRAWLQYLSVLAYPAADHPWWSTSTPLWTRFGEEFGLRWVADAVAQLEVTLADDLVREGLEQLTALELDEGDERAEVERVCEEIAVLQLDRDLPRRRAIVARKLVAEAPAPYWDDEYGG